NASPCRARATRAVGLSQRERRLARVRPKPVLVTEYGHPHKLKETGMLRRLILALLISTGVAWAQHPDDVFVGQKAPELKDGDAWINSSALKLEQLRGKVVIIDFWAWDCPFCAQSMPHVIEM